MYSLGVKEDAVWCVCMCVCVCSGKGEIQKELLEKELESVGIRLNKARPNIYFKVGILHAQSREPFLVEKKGNIFLCVIIIGGLQGTAHFEGGY